MGRFVENLTSTVDAHRLVVVFDVPSSGPYLRLERNWSAAELGLTFHKDAPYHPLPGVVDMDRLLEELAGMLPDLVSLAGGRAPER
ncbi:hypothetical protein [Streptomyces sp. HUAS ZL42]|uniref:hypothetical protein n=1 Tax=Streptomyces sp. HUAS ZL42 TaxID=3231715 RepID=UPI00345E0A40